ncbi:MAG: hypothetical protein IJX17_01580 [Clostridia bacterium]|nr:hypothetical protein [Clostridia bacterium]
MFFNKNKPSIGKNNELKEKVVKEVNSFIYDYEKGRILNNNKEALNPVMQELKDDVISLENSFGTGNENVSSIYNEVTETLKKLKQPSTQDMLHRTQEAIGDLSFQINYWKDVLNGDAVVVFDKSNAATAKISYERRKLNLKLSELLKLKDDLKAQSDRIEKEIVLTEKDKREIDSIILNEKNQRKAAELVRNAKTKISQINTLSTHKKNYMACYDLLDTIYINAKEIVEVSDFEAQKIGKAKALLNIDMLRQVLTDPSKALYILERMNKEMELINTHTERIDDKILKTIYADDELNEETNDYIEQLKRERMEQEGLADIKKEMEQLQTGKTDVKKEEVE